MKKLEFKEGSITPFWLKDLEYMQEGIEEALKGIVEGLSFGKKYMLISGCNITYKDGRISMTPGWFYYEGKILPVEALPESECENNLSTIYLEKVIEHNDFGDRFVLLSTGRIKDNPYKIEYLKPSLQAPDNCEIGIIMGAWNLSDRASKNNIDTGLITVDFTGIKEVYNSTLKYRQIGNIVLLTGHISITDSISQINLPKPILSPCTIHPIQDGTFVDMVFNDKKGWNIFGSGNIFFDGVMYLSDSGILGTYVDGHIELNNSTV